MGNDVFSKRAAAIDQKQRQSAALLLKAAEQLATIWSGDRPETLSQEERGDRLPWCNVCDGVERLYRYKVSAVFSDGRLGDLLMDECANCCPKCGRIFGTKAGRDAP